MGGEFDRCLGGEYRFSFIDFYRASESKEHALTND